MSPSPGPAVGDCELCLTIEEFINLLVYEFMKNYLID